MSDRPQLDRLPGGLSLDLLVRRTVAGDVSAFTQLFDHTRTQVFSLAHHILRDWQMAEEVTLDVYVEVWRSADRIEAEGADVMAWLMTLARYRSIDRRRARDRRRKLESLPLVETVRETCDDGLPEPCTCSSKDERDHRLRDALSSLPSVQRRAIELAYFPGLSQVEIAERLGQPLGTIKSRIRLGMKKMKEKLCRMEDDR